MPTLTSHTPPGRRNRRIALAVALTALAAPALVIDNLPSGDARPETRPVAAVTTTVTTTTQPIRMLYEVAKDWQPRQRSTFGGSERQKRLADIGYNAASAPATTAPSSSIPVRVVTLDGRVVDPAAK